MTGPLQRRARRLALTTIVVALCAAGAACAQQRVSPETRERAQAAMQACRADYASFCSGVQPGGGRVLACLRAQEPQRLSPDCRNVLAKAVAR